MDDQAKQEAARRARRRLVRIGAAAGMVLGLVCHCLPPRYQAACNTVSQVTALTCGPGGH
jgi:hypothetical protein